MRENIFDAGMLEIYRFVPSALLEGMDVDRLELEEFLDLLAKARYLQEVEAAIIQQGIADAFGAE